MTIEEFLIYNFPNKLNYKSTSYYGFYVPLYTKMIDRQGKSAKINMGQIPNLHIKIHDIRKGVAWRDCFHGNLYVSGIIKSSRKEYSFDTTLFLEHTETYRTIQLYIIEDKI